MFYVIIPDTHVPYHHVRALASWLSFAEHYQEQMLGLILLGDFADFYAVNSHGLHPTLTHLLVDEINQVNDVLSLIDATLPNTPKVYIEGNHEYRLERYLCNKAPALFGVTQWDLLFKLNQRPNWLAVPYGPTQHYKPKGLDVYIRHEPYSMGSAKASLSNSCCNLIYGHIHRREYFSVAKPCGERIFNASPGWLGDIRQKDVYSYLKKPPQWDLGFALLHESGLYEPIHMNSLGEFSYEGKKFKAL